MGRRLRVYDLDATLGTIATGTGNNDQYCIAGKAGTVIAAFFSGVDALTASDTNYITFTITNLGQAGSGTLTILGAVNANTTKTTGGSALAANTKRVLTLSTTASDLIVNEGDRLRVRAAVTGTLPNTVTFSNCKILIEANGA